MFEQLLTQLANRPTAQGITMIDVLDMPAPLDSAIRRMIREGTLSLGRLAQELVLAEDQARILAALLVEKGVVTAEQSPGGEQLYRVRFVAARRRPLPAKLLGGLEEE
jgi:hypothetical protein